MPAGSFIYGGLAVGIAFLSTILTRGRADAWSDRIGGKPTHYAAGPSDLCRSRADLPSGELVEPSRHGAVLIGGRLMLGLGESVAMVDMMG